jgi:hypothetical protein
MALEATRADVLTLVLTDGMRLTSRSLSVG